LTDERGLARVLRKALRHEVEAVPLVTPPASAGQHLLEIEVPGAAPIVLLADPVAAATPQGHPLHVRPVTREQMAVILAVAERLDPEPSHTIPPPAGPVEEEPAPESGSFEETYVSDDERLPREGLTSAPPPAFGVIDSVVPMGVGDVNLPEHALVGRLVARKYRIESVIGSGASAAVFRATNIENDQIVAVKILHEQNRSDVQFVKRFKAEALAASRLQHPNVSRVLDFGLQKDGLLYIAMELLSGRSLEAVVAAEGRLSSHATAWVGLQAARALAFAHAKGIIHRDVKPENIMLVPGEDDAGQPCDIVKVCDFGLAKLRDPDPEHADLTMAGMLCGSPAYMSPEQTRGEQLDARTDIYSLGVTLFETVTGALPHEAETLAELFVKKVIDAPRRASQLVPDVHPGLDTIIDRALATDRKKRYDQASELYADLAQVFG
jgi:serine/threonine-protein kinase